MIEFTPSRIVYLVLHQRREDVPEERYTERFTAFAQAVEAQAKAWASRAPAWPENPIVLSLGLDRLGDVVSDERRTVAAEGSTAEAVAAIERGRAYLQSLGFQDADGGRPVHETRFVVTGAVHLDVLEHLVRDHMGIYQPPHSGVITAFSRVTFNLFNVVATFEPPGGVMPEGPELALFFGKPGRPGQVKYADFREGLRTWLERLVEHQEARAELWQRKLGLGRLREFVVRVHGTDSDALMRHATDHAVTPAVAQAILEEAALVAFERPA
ncbi:MAG TPA: hypothetical protein VNN12_01580 [Dehalococcoidia bacterium]|jgi:hypothetical protein|nr:hypothetical protein [Dehalococcoidia bacterium]